MAVELKAGAHALATVSSAARLIRAAKAEGPHEVRTLMLFGEAPFFAA
jgi:hypothetical protein